jgi:hypothetical protein
VHPETFKDKATFVCSLSYLGKFLISYRFLVSWQIFGILADFWYLGRFWYLCRFLHAIARKICTYRNESLNSTMSMCPRTFVLGLCGYLAREVFLGRCVPWMIRPLDGIMERPKDDIFYAYPQPSIIHPNMCWTIYRLLC